MWRRQGSAPAKGTYIKVQGLTMEILRLVLRWSLDATAEDAVNYLDRKDSLTTLTEPKSFRNPPIGFDKITLAVLNMNKGVRENFSLGRVLGR